MSQLSTEVHSCEVCRLPTPQWRRQVHSQHLCPRGCGSPAGQAALRDTPTRRGAGAQSRPCPLWQDPGKLSGPALPEFNPQEGKPGSRQDCTPCTSVWSLGPTFFVLTQLPAHTGCVKMVVSGKLTESISQARVPQGRTQASGGPRKTVPFRLLRSVSRGQEPSLVPPLPSQS